MTKKFSIPNFALVTLFAVTVGLILRSKFGTDWFEFAGFVTGIVGVYLVSVEHILNWPVGLTNVSIYAWVFYTGSLKADMALQFFFFAMGVQGWYQWLRGGEGKTQLKISRLRPLFYLWIVITWVAGTAVLYPIIHHFKGDFALIDSALTVGSIMAQLLLNLKYLENWILWIIVDIAYIPLYISKKYEATAILYTIFLILAISGLYNWHKTYKAASNPSLT